jgi:hypothetical protein
MKWERPVMISLGGVGPCHCTKPLNQDPECPDWYTFDYFCPSPRLMDL